MPEAKECTKYKFTKFEEPLRSAKGASVGSKKTKAARRSGLQKSKEQSTFSPKAFYPAGGSEGVSTVRVVKTQMQEVVDQTESGTGSGSDPSLAPILGMGLKQFGMETTGLYSSSDEWSSDSDGGELMQN